jgi:hypothetical protein
MPKNEIYLQEFPKPMLWLNTLQAPSFENYLGRAIALVFFTPSSTYSLELLQELKLLQQRLNDGLQVVGVLVPRFDAEKDTDFCLQQLQRLHLRMPVALDRDYMLWRGFGIKVWPTTIVIDPRGKIIGSFLGNDQRAKIEECANEALELSILAGTRNFEPMANPRMPEAKTFVSFPTAIAANEQRIFICETPRNRILECTHDGRLTRIFGSGTAGLWDGKNLECGFDQPQGITVTGETLFVADTGNNAIRKIDLISGSVSTLVGKIARAVATFSTEPAPPLLQPIGLQWHQDRLYISSSANHQIQCFDFHTNKLRWLAGSGHEDQRNGEAALARFAEPTAVAVVRDQLYVLDASSSSLRSVRLVDGETRTIVGGGMFEFGDQDGNVAQARMQRPRAMCADLTRGVLWIADGYNNRLKIYSLAKGETKTVNLNYPLKDPCGLAISANSLWISNTLAHEILRLDLKTGKLLRVALSE